MLVEEGERVVGIHGSVEAASAHNTDESYLIIRVTNQELGSGDFILKMETGVDLADVVAEHDAEIDELFKRVGNLEEDFYGEEQSGLTVEFEPDDESELN